MKKFLKICILLIVLGVVAYQFHATFSRFLAQTPCAKPIPYTIGTFDPKFNLLQSYFLGALADAEAIWEKPSGKDLFIYVPNDSSPDVLKINLIYDYRQQATGKLADLGIAVKDDRASYDMLKAKFTALKAGYDQEKNAYAARLADFNQKKQIYENEVSSWNAQGRGTREEYNQIEADRVALQAESQELQTTETNLNSTVDELNSLAVVLNRLVATLNLSVEKYNTTNTARGESFEEGVYQSDASGREINIYEFSSREKLVRVLAHELGHALGLGHAADPKAIMYELNQSTNEALTEADLSLLQTRCGIK